MIDYEIGLSASLGCITVSTYKESIEEVYETRVKNKPEAEYTLAARCPRASRKRLLAIIAFSIAEVIVVRVCETCEIKKNNN